jgi:hypothetical protein
MIDRIARDKMAEAIRHYLTGVATNFRFDNTLFEIQSADLAIEAIRGQLWLIYDDLREHRAKDAWRPTGREREVVLRTILFLKSDLEYRWPTVPTWYGALRPLIGLLTLGAGVRWLDRTYEFKDLEGVWPFKSSEEIQAAMSEPRYLASAT